MFHNLTDKEREDALTPLLDTVMRPHSERPKNAPYYFMCRDIARARELQSLRNWDEWQFLLVALIEVNGYGYKELGKVLKTPEATIKTFYYRMIPEKLLRMKEVNKKEWQRQKNKKESEYLELVKQGETGAGKCSGLYLLALSKLKEEGFTFNDYYWILDANVHQIPSCVDCNCPGISLTFPNRYGNFKIQSVVQTDSFSDGAIEVRDEEQLRAVLSVMILLIKNWHERLIQLEEDREREELQAEIDEYRKQPVDERKLEKARQILEDLTIGKAMNDNQ
jgi:hypothetical protein